MIQESIIKKYINFETDLNSFRDLISKNVKDKNILKIPNESVYNDSDRTQQADWKLQ